MEDIFFYSRKEGRQIAPGGYSHVKAYRDVLPKFHKKSLDKGSFGQKNL